MINPTGIIPLGPEQDFTTAHGREEFKREKAFLAQPLIGEVA
jgi:hypothetical protein